MLEEVVLIIIVAFVSVILSKFIANKITFSIRTKKDYNLVVLIEVTFFIAVIFILNLLLNLPTYFASLASLVFLIFHIILIGSQISRRR